MKAIPTTYRGVRMRSKLEARWAEFFDAIGARWEYESEGYQTAAGWYLPDFWLPNVCSRGKPGGLFFEVKPTSPNEGETDKAMALACGTGRTVIVPARGPGIDEPESLHEFVGGVNGWEDFDLTFARCDDCGGLDIGFYASDEPACQCGCATFNPFNSALESARRAFQNLSRWNKAA